MSYPGSQYFKKLWVIYIIQIIIFLAVIAIIIQIFLGVNNSKGYIFAAIVIALFGVAGLKTIYADQKKNIEILNELEGREGKGYRAEEKMIELLETLPSEFKIVSNYKKDHGDIDHIIIGPTGIFCIETKGSTGMVGFHNNSLYINSGCKFCSGYINQCLDGKKYLEDRIFSKSGKRTRITSILAFSFATVDTRSINSPINGVWVAEGSFVIELIKHNKDFLSRQEIRNITALLHAVAKV